MDVVGLMAELSLRYHQLNVYGQCYPREQVQAMAGGVWLISRLPDYPTSVAVCRYNGKAATRAAQPGIGMIGCGNKEQKRGGEFCWCAAPTRLRAGERVGRAQLSSSFGSSKS